MGDRADLYHPRFADNWRQTSLHPLATWINGMAFRNIHFSASGRPVIKISEIKNGITQQTKRTDQEYDYRHFVKSGDLLFSWSGQPESSIGAFIWRGPEGWLNQHVFRVQVDISECDDRFFKLLLDYLQPNFVEIARNKQTTGLGHVTKRDLESLTVALPPLTEQCAIAEVLGVLDDKIEANRRVVERGEQLAQCLAKAVPPSVTVGDIANIRRQMVAPAHFADSNVDHFSLPAFDDGSLPVRTSGSKIKSGKLLLEEPAVLVSKLNPHIPRIWLARPAMGVRAVTSTEFVVLVPAAGCKVELLWAMCSEPRFCKQLIEMVKGTTGSHQRVASEDVLNLLVPSPDEFSNPILDTIRSSVQLAISLRDESAKLAALRDALLPKLLSGELRVRDAEDVVSESV